MKKLKIYLLIGGIALGGATGPLHASRILDALWKAFGTAASITTTFTHGPRLFKEHAQNWLHPEEAPQEPASAPSNAKSLVESTHQQQAAIASPFATAPTFAALRRAELHKTPLTQTLRPHTTHIIEQIIDNPSVVAETAPAPTENTLTPAITPRLSKTKIGMLIVGTAAIAGCCYMAYQCYYKRQKTKNS